MKLIKLFLNKKKPKKVKINEQMEVKTNMTPEKIILPKSKKFNLKDPNLKRKGI